MKDIFEKVFAFAFGPENPYSRKVLSKSESELEINFDMTSEPAPECAGVAILFDTKNAAPESIKFKFEFDTPFKLFLELKSGEDKFKYSEAPILNGEVLEVRTIPDTTEIVVVCWNSINVGKKGDVKIKVL